MSMHGGSKEPEPQVSKGSHICTNSLHISGTPRQKYLWLAALQNFVVSHTLCCFSFRASI